MDKNAIKKYAVWARRELIERVSQRAAIYGITDKDPADPSAESVNGRLLSQKEKRQRQALIQKIQEKGYENVIEEVAYTWFNRFASLRFMEVNGYLPSYVRVFTNDAGEFKPQILTEAIHLELKGLNRDTVYELLNANKTDELYKYLIIVQCNALNDILPGMFQKIDDYTELLFPDNILREGSVIEQMVTAIPEEDWKDQVQIIGWLYQYYNTEPKDKVFADLKKNIKITKEKIPAATQLFTPDWIVHYMVENSLGRLWLEGHPNAGLKSEWKYYLDEAEQEPEVQAKLAEIRKEYAKLKPEEIRVIDPCSGSGHILCVLFDVLIRIYEDYGYSAADAAACIVRNNIWGLDIDERAAQLSYFAVMMKARQYDRRFFTRNIQPHVYAIEESNGITFKPMKDLGSNLSAGECREALQQTVRLIEEMQDAKEYGSLIKITPCDWDLLRRFAVSKDETSQLQFNDTGLIDASARLQRLIDIGEALAQKYHVVVTNPPYMGSSGMSGKLGDFVKLNYSDSKSDLFACFIEQCKYLTINNGLQAMITQHSWMFLSSFEKLRSKLQASDVINMIHLGARAFEEIRGEVVQSTSFVIRHSHLLKFRGVYVRLVNPNTQQGKEDMFLSGENRYITDQSNFIKIPSAPIAYWVSSSLYDRFKGNVISDYGDTRSGMSTTDNERFLRLWFEEDISNIKFDCLSLEEAKLSKEKWYPYNKGGDFRKWYGNNAYVVNWLNDGAEIKYWVTHNPKDPKTTSWSRRIFATDCFFKDGITWSSVTIGVFSCRLYETGFIFDSGANGLFAFEKSNRYYLAGLLNSKVGDELLGIINPSINNGPGSVGKIPVLIENHDRVSQIVMENYEFSKMDWDSFENSWDFKYHPLIASAFESAKSNHVYTLKQAFEDWQSVADERFRKLKQNEEELNRIFIEIYGLQDELTPEVEDKDVTVRKADLQRDIRSFISYAVGCMFGRYSLDVPGLAYAGGEWDASKYRTFQPDADGIIPICDDEYFEDDIVGRFVKFVEVVYGKETLDENLRFIADAIGGKGSPRDILRKYFISDFYADHLKVYQKRPIYWLFDSGKKNGFKCLIYLHRYRPDTLARIRTDYIHEQQSRYRTAIDDLEKRIDKASGSERAKLNKQLVNVQDQAVELRIYEEKIHHLADKMIRIDLDDGVKHNYEIFSDVLAKIK